MKSTRSHSLLKLQTKLAQLRFDLNAANFEIAKKVDLPLSHIFKLKIIEPRDFDEICDLVEIEMLSLPDNELREHVDNEHPFIMAGRSIDRMVDKFRNTENLVTQRLSMFRPR